MKTLTLLTLSFLFATGVLHAQSPEEMVADINRLLCGPTPELVSTKYLGEIIADNDITRNNFNTQFRYVRDNAGECDGYELLEKIRYSESVIGYRYIFKYSMPLVFKFLFYEYQGKWKITYFYFSQNTAVQLGLDDD